MTAIFVTEPEAAVLRELLDAKLVDLKREIAHTDSRGFRKTLHQVESTLERVLAQMPAGAAGKTEPLLDSTNGSAHGG